ncbi:hypothetical protein HWV62_26773 [Athelia sp. TMB]|nr:hypothetical protein HWV62_26773 [Athelia sp. TMB]
MKRPSFLLEDLSQTNTDLDDEGWGELIDVELDEQDLFESGVKDSDSEVEDEVESLQPSGRPDKDTLLMPSSLSPFVVQRFRLQHLADLELKLRIGQLNDSLDGLMLALCTQGLLLRTKVRNASGTKTKTRAFNEVTKVRREVEFHVRSYRRARKALLALTVDVELINHYRPINKEDLKTADFTDERRLGQSTDTLAWFWMIGAGEAGKNELKEEFYRVSWLRGKARRDRWDEEVAIVSHEMLFVILSHPQEAEIWEQRGKMIKGEGQKAFAYQKMLVARKRAEEAQAGFAGKAVKANWERKRK